MNADDSDDENGVLYFLPGGIADDSPPKRNLQPASPLPNSFGTIGPTLTPPNHLNSFRLSNSLNSDGRDALNNTLLSGLGGVPVPTTGRGREDNVFGNGFGNFGYPNGNNSIGMGSIGSSIGTTHMNSQTAFQRSMNYMKPSTTSGPLRAPPGLDVPAPAPFERHLSNEDHTFGFMAPMRTPSSPSEQHPMYRPPPFQQTSNVDLAELNTTSIAVTHDRDIQPTHTIGEHRFRTFTPRSMPEASTTLPTHDSQPRGSTPSKRRPVVQDPKPERKENHFSKRTSSNAGSPSSASSRESEDVRSVDSTSPNAGQSSISPPPSRPSPLVPGSIRIKQRNPLSNRSSSDESPKRKDLTQRTTKPSTSSQATSVPITTTTVPTTTTPRRTTPFYREKAVKQPVQVSQEVSEKPEKITPRRSRTAKTTKQPQTPQVSTAGTEARHVPTPSTPQSKKIPKKTTSSAQPAKPHALGEAEKVEVNANKIDTNTIPSTSALEKLANSSRSEDEEKIHSNEANMEILADINSNGSLPSSGPHPLESTDGSDMDPSHRDIEVDSEEVPIEVASPVFANDVVDDQASTSSKPAPAKQPSHLHQHTEPPPFAPEDLHQPSSEDDTKVTTSASSVSTSKKRAERKNRRDTPSHALKLEKKKSDGIKKKQKEAITVDEDPLFLATEPSTSTSMAAKEFFASLCLAIAGHEGASKVVASIIYYLQLILGLIFSIITFVAMQALNYSVKFHRLAVRSFAINRNIASCFAFLYAFPLLVQYVIPWAPPWAPVCLWYAFLVQLFCTQGSTAMVATFRILLPLVFLVEGVSHHSFLLDLNGAELLLISFILSSVKAGNLYSPLFFMSLSAQCMSAVFLGSELIVQWVQLAVALYSLHAMTLGDDEWGLDDENAFGHSPFLGEFHQPSGTSIQKTKRLDRRSLATVKGRKPRTSSSM